jgi:hypothetical protein
MAAVMPEIVYKSCQKKWIVTLKTLEDTITNISRPLSPIGVADAQHAKFRGNKFMVVRIEDKHDPTITIDSVANSCYANSKLVYTVGEIVEVPDYDMNLNKICSTGIHFFLSKEAAFQYERCGNDGVHIMYHENGNRCYESTYVDGVPDESCVIKIARRRIQLW